MNPNGFVAAASTTSQTSMPIRSQSCASSLTSAMLTERKMFSSSFVSSAASGDETRWTVSIARAVERGRGLGRRLVDRRRRPSGRSSSSSRCGPGRRARARTRGGSRRRRRARTPRSRIGCSVVARRARIRRRLEHDELTRAAGGVAISAPRCGTIERSGSRCLRERRRQRDQDRVGVAQHVVVGRRGEAALGRRARGAARTGRPRCSSRRGSSCATRSASTSTRRTVRPASAKTCASGTPT